MTALDLLLLLSMLLLAQHGALAARAAPEIAIVVSRDAPVGSLDKEEISRIFLRKKAFWENRDAILPVNLEVSNPLRRLFSERVLGMDPEALDDYWNGQYYHGIFPPYVVASEEAVLRFVSESPNAIGYVSACSVDRRVKALLYIADEPLEPGGDSPRHCTTRSR